VQAVPIGSVRQRGGSLAIVVELVNTLDETQVWGEHYNLRASNSAHPAKAF